MFKIYEIKKGNQLYRNSVDDIKNCDDDDSDCKTLCKRKCFVANSGS